MKILNALGRLVRRNPTCEDVNRFLVDYLDDELPPGTRRRFEKHLDMCRECHTFLDQYRETIRLVREDDVEIPAGIAEHTLEFLRSKSVWH